MIGHILKSRRIGWTQWQRDMLLGVIRVGHQTIERCEARKMSKEELTKWFIEALKKEKDMNRSDVYEAIVIELPEEKFYEQISAGKRRDLCKLLTPTAQIVLAASLEEAKKKVIVQWLTDPSMREKLVDPERLEVLCRPF